MKRTTDLSISVPIDTRVTQFSHLNFREYGKIGAGKIIKVRYF